MGGMSTKIFICIFFCLLLPIAHSEVSTAESFSGDITIKGDVGYTLEKERYLAGEIIKTNISVSNLEDFPIADCYLVIQLVQGEARIPNIDENVFYEEATPAFTLAPGSSKTLPFQYVLPSDLAGGTYRLEVYMAAARSYAVGLPYIFLGPGSRVFSVDSAGVFPYARIMRNETVFMDIPFQGGPLVNASAQVSGTVFIRNNQTKSANYALNVTVCEWDDTSCVSGPAVSRSYSISAGPSSVTKAPVSFVAPAKPSAYSIKLELRDERGRLVSLYRSRIVVSGEAARIRKAATDRLYYNAGDNGKIMLLIGPSPDQITLPVIGNATVSVSVKSKGGEQVFSDSSVIPALSIEQGLMPVFFEFAAPKEVRDYSVCSKIQSSSGRLFDEYCFVVDSLAAPAQTDVNASFAYDASKGVFQVELCAWDTFGAPSSAKVSAVLMRSSDLYVVDYVEGIMPAPCQSISLKAPAGDYTLIINVLETNRQVKYHLIAAGGSVSTTLPGTTTSLGPSNELLETCGNGLCGGDESAESCCIDCGCDGAGKCVDGTCISANSQAGDNGYYLAAGILLLIIGFLLYAKRPRRKENDQPKEAGI
jgi:hypothetical protein